MHDKNLRLLREFINYYNINIFTEHLDAAGEYTYRNDNTQAYSMIDHCMATHGLKTKGFNVQIMDDVDDFSDHRPLNITLSCSILTTDVFAECKCIYAKWNDDTKSMYYDNTCKLLYNINVPNCDVEGMCCSSDHCTMIDDYCKQIIVALQSSTVWGDLEVIAFEIYTCAQPLVICCIYNSSGHNVQSVRIICDIVHYLCNNFCCICILGDFNIPMLESCLKHRSQVPISLFPLIDALNVHCLDQIVDCPSRQNNYLDLIFCSTFLMHNGVHSTPPLGKSDHEGQSFNIFSEYLCRVQNQDVNHYSDFKNADYSQFGLWLQNIDWYSLLSQIDNVEEMWLVLMHKIDRGRVMFVPTKSKHSSSHPSYPAHIIRLQSEKRRLWRSRHNLVSKIKYNNANKRYKIAVEKYHVNKERNLLKLNSKNFFKHMNRKLCSQNSIPNLRKDNNNITSNTDKANEFLNIFSSVLLLIMDY